jgi:hypothetical protein
MNAIPRNCFFLQLCAISMMLFVSSCDDDDELEIQYPETGFYGDNILMKGKTEYTDERNSLQAKVPEGKQLKVVITGLSVTSTANYMSGIWYYEAGSSNNLAISIFDSSDYAQVFQSIDGGLTCDLAIRFEKGTFRIDYYENNAVSPTDSKTIIVNY